MSTPDPRGLTDAQRAALRDHQDALLVYREAIERRMAAQYAEGQALERVQVLARQAATPQYEGQAAKHQEDHRP